MDHDVGFGEVDPTMNFCKKIGSEDGESRCAGEISVLADGSARMRSGRLEWIERLVNAVDVEHVADEGSGPSEGA